VYERAGTNLSLICILSPGTSACGASDVFGAGIEFSSAGAGVSFSFGTWAVTAP
jgi:hypothetical protein